MNIKGIINFKTDLFASSLSNELNRTNSFISWEKGYISIQDFELETFYTYLIGVEFTNSRDIEYLSNTKLDYSMSFSFFNACLKGDNNCILHSGIWYNQLDNRLYLARDCFGLVPLYYIHVPHYFIAFSTSIASLIKMKELEGFLDLNQNRISGYCTFRYDEGNDYTSETFYKNIKSVLPGHIISIDAGDLVSTPYIKFSTDNWNGLKHLNEYGLIFHDLLKNSVHRNIKDESKQLGSHLSGGLDSSSISSLVKYLDPDRPLHTFYYNVDGVDSNDRTYALSAAEEIGSLHHEILPLGNHLEQIQAYTGLYGHPQGGYISPTFQGSLMKCAGELGSDILLNGSDGDNIVGSGLEYMDQLYKEKNWELLKILLQKRVNYFSLTNKYSNWQNLTFQERTYIVEQNFLFNRLAEQFKKLTISQFYNIYKEVSSEFDISVGYFLKRGLDSANKKLSQGYVPPLSILRNEVIASIKATSTRVLSTSLRGELSNEYQQSFQDVYNAQSIWQNEERFFMSKYYGFRNHSPFYDKQLFELCLAVPTLIKFGEGQGRAHFREAMKGVLPENVRTRHQKAVVGSFGRKVTLELYDQSKDILMNSTQIWEYVDKEKFFNSLKFLKTEGIPTHLYNRSLFHITRTISLAVWLEWLKSNSFKD